MAQPGRDYQMVLVAILKGGCRKTTTAMMLAFALAARGKDVTVIDADAGTQGVTEWASDVYANGGELPFDVFQWTQSLGLLVPFIQARQRETGAQIVITDVGGEAPEVVRQAIKLADQVITPVGAESAEIRRITPTAQLVKAAGTPMSVLLNRVPQPGKGAALAARQDISGDGYTVLKTEVPQNRELYSDVFGTVPAELGAYARLVDELGLGA